MSYTISSFNDLIRELSSASGESTISIISEIEQFINEVYCDELIAYRMEDDL